MSSNSSESTNDEEGDELSNAEDEDSLWSEEEEEEEESSQADLDLDLFTAVKRNDATGVWYALRNGANVNCTIGDANFPTPLMKACAQQNDEVVRILLDASAETRFNNRAGWSAFHHACSEGHTSIIEILLSHDDGLLEIRTDIGWTPLVVAIKSLKFGIVHRLLDCGANALATDEDESTTLMLACQGLSDLRLVRRLLAAGVSVEALNDSQRTALHYAALMGGIEAMRALVVEHDADILAADDGKETPFDLAMHSNFPEIFYTFLIECYGNILIQEHGRLALHAILVSAEYLSADPYSFHPPLINLEIRVPLGYLTLQQFRTLLSSLDPERIRNRDESGKLPIHIACRSKVPVEVLAWVVEHDAATLHMTDNTGALPLHCGCCGAVDDSNVRFLFEQGGVGTLAARNRQGALPLHVLCGSTKPSLRTVQYLMQSFPGSVALRTNDGQYPFMTAACESSTASLSVVYTLVRANPRLAIPN